MVGDPWKSRAEIVRLLQRSPIRITRIGYDRYGRTLALVNAGGIDLSCWQVRTNHAVYVAKWDTGRRLAAICPRM